MPVEIMLYTAGPDTMIQVPITTAPQQVMITLPDSVTAIGFDPNAWILKTCQVFIGIDEFGQTNPVNALSFLNNPTRSPCIKFSLNHQTDVRILLYDVSGRLVKDIIGGRKNPGTYQIDVGEMNAGIYFCRLETAQEELVEKFVVIHRQPAADVA